MIRFSIKYSMRSQLHKTEYNKNMRNKYLVCANMAFDLMTTMIVEGLLSTFNDFNLVFKIAKSTGLVIKATNFSQSSRGNCNNPEKNHL